MSLEPAPAFPSSITPVGPKGDSYFPIVTRGKPADSIGVDGQVAVDWHDGIVYQKALGQWNDGEGMFAGVELHTLHVQRISSVAALRSHQPSSARAMFVLAYHADAPHGGGGGLYYGDSGKPAGTYVDNGGTVIVPHDGNGSAAWLFDRDAPVTPKNFGARGRDNSADAAADTAAILAWITATATEGRTGYGAAGDYWMTRLDVSLDRDPKLDLHPQCRFKGVKSWQDFYGNGATSSFTITEMHPSLYLEGRGINVELIDVATNLSIKFLEPGEHYVRTGATLNLLAGTNPHMALATGHMIKVTSRSAMMTLRRTGEAEHIEIRGGNVDCSERGLALARDSGSGIVLVGWKRVTNHLTGFRGALHWEDARARRISDTGLVVNSCFNVDISGAYYEGWGDKGIYLTGGGDAGELDNGGNVNITGSFFIGCEGGLKAIRQMERVNIANCHFFDIGSNGILNGPLPGGLESGTHYNLSNITAERIGRRFGDFRAMKRGVSMKGVRIIDIGYMRDGSTPFRNHDGSVDPAPMGVFISGSAETILSDCWIGQDKWPSTNNQEAVRVNSTTYGDGTLALATHVRTNNLTIARLPKGVGESGVAERIQNCLHTGLKMVDVGVPMTVISASTAYEYWDNDNRKWQGRGPGTAFRSDLSPAQALEADTGAITVDGAGLAIGVATGREDGGVDFVVVVSKSSPEDVLAGEDDASALTPLSAPEVLRRLGDSYDIVAHGGCSRDGAVGNAAKLAAMIASGARITAPGGRFRVDGNIVVPATKDIWLDLHASTEFYVEAPPVGGSPGSYQGDMISILPPAGGVGLPEGRLLNIHIERGAWNMVGLKNSTSMPYNAPELYPPAPERLGTAATGSALRIWGVYELGGVVYPAFDRVEIGEGFFYSGGHWQDAWADDHIFIGGCRRVVLDNHHVGARDCGAYVSGDLTGAIGENADIKGRYQNCFVGVALKRSFSNARVAPDVRNCVMGLSINKLAGPGVEGVDVGGSYDRCNYALRVDEDCKGVVMTAATVTNLGATLADDSPVLLVPPAPILCGVFFNSGEDCVVAFNRFDGVNPAWAAVPGAFGYATYFAQRIEGKPSHDNLMIHNRVANMRGPAFEVDGRTYDNFYANNRLTNCTLAGAAIAETSGSSEERWNATHKMRQLVRRGLLLPDGTVARAALARAADPTTGFDVELGAAVLRAGGPVRLRARADRVEATVPLIQPVEHSVAAAGSTYGTARLLTAAFTEVSTCAPGAGVRLLAAGAVLGWGQTVFNNTANVLIVYAFSGEGFEGRPADLVFKVFPGETVEFFAFKPGVWRPMLGPVRAVNLIAAPVAHTGSTAETTLATLLIPAYAMGLNGGARITYAVSGTASANTKTWRARFSGAGGTALRTLALGASPNMRDQAEVRNAGSLTTQRATPGGLTAGGFAAGGGTFLSLTVDTAADATIVLTGQLADAGETMTLEYAHAEIFRA